MLEEEEARGERACGVVRREWGVGGVVGERRGIVVGGFGEVASEGGREGFKL